MIMARENLEEWGTNAEVEHETVRAVVEAYAEGRVVLPEPSGSEGQKYRYAPGFKSERFEPARTGRYTAGTVSAFLAWSPDKVNPILLSSPPRTAAR